MKRIDVICKSLTFSLGNIPLFLYLSHLFRNHGLEPLLLSSLLSILTLFSILLQHKSDVSLSLKNLPKPVLFFLNFLRFFNFIVRILPFFNQTFLFLFCNRPASHLRLIMDQSWANFWLSNLYTHNFIQPW